MTEHETTEPEFVDLETLTIEELRTYAAERDIPLTGLTLKADIVEQISRSAVPPAVVDEDQEDDVDAAMAELVTAGLVVEVVDEPATSYPAVVVDALVSADIDVDRVEFWRLEGDRLAVGHRQGGTLVGTKIVLTDEQVAELVDLNVTGGGRA